MRKCKETTKRAMDALKERYLVMVSLSDLRTEDYGVDSNFELNRIQAELTEHGLLQPVSVVGPYEDGSYLIIDGARRVNAFRQMASGKEDVYIPCYVVGDDQTSFEDAKLLAYASNRIKRTNDSVLNLRYTEMVYDLAVRQKIKEQHMSSMIARMTGLSTRMARKYITVVDQGGQKLKEWIREGSLGICEAYDICTYVAGRNNQYRCAKILMDAPRGAKEVLLQRLRKGYSISNSEEIIASYQDTQNVRQAAEQIRYLIDKSLDEAAVATLLDACKEFCSMYS